MKKFIPKEKLSKKAKRQKDLGMRKTWGALSPVTRKAPDIKEYRREKPSRLYDDDGAGVFHILTFFVCPARNILFAKPA